MFLNTLLKKNISLHKLKWNNMYDFGKKAVIVTRVSTYTQDTAAQNADLELWAKQQLGIEESYIITTTESGFLQYDDKQGWNKVTEFFEMHSDYKILICTEISRLSRRKSILMLIQEYLMAHKIQLYIKDINFALFNTLGEVPAGNDLIFTLFASLAQSEMQTKKERFLRARAEYMKEGYSIGGKELFGYTRNYKEYKGKQRSYYVINEKEAEEIKTIFKLYAYGIDGQPTLTSVRKITQYCIEKGMSPYLHSKRNVNKCLKEEAYLGLKQTQNKQKNSLYFVYKQREDQNGNPIQKYVPANSFMCSYPPIFESEEEKTLFEIVQKRLNDNNQRKGGTTLLDKSTKHFTILSKILRCPDCGRFLIGEYRQPKRFVYRCSFSRASIDICTNKHTQSMVALDSIVVQCCLSAIQYKLLSEELNEQPSLSKYDAEIKNLEKKIDELQSDILTEDNIYRSRTKRDRQNSEKYYEQYLRDTNKIQKEIDVFRKRKEELQVKKNQYVQQKNIIKSVYERIDDIYNDKKALHEYIHLVLDEVELVYQNKQNTVIRLHFRDTIPVYVTTNNHYVCINKRNTQKIKAMSITYEEIFETPTGQGDNDGNEIMSGIPEHKLDGKIIWDSSSETFKTPEGDFSLTDIFTEKKESDVFNPSIQPLSIRIKPINYKKLDCYQND